MSLKLRRACRTEGDQRPACTFFEASSAEAVEGSGRRAALGIDRMVEATTTRGVEVKHSAPAGVDDGQLLLPLIGWQRQAYS